LADTTHDLVLVHRGLSQRAKQAVPDSPVIIFDMFLGDMRIAQLVNEIQEGHEISDA
jgi:mannitol-specific phosphotransferase system IIBC component